MGRNLPLPQLRPIPQPKPLSVAVDPQKQPKFAGRKLKAQFNWAIQLVNWGQTTFPLFVANTRVGHAAFSPCAALCKSWLKFETGYCVSLVLTFDA